MQWEIPASHPVSPACEDLLRRLIVQVSIGVKRGAGGRGGTCQDLLRQIIVQVSGGKWCAYC